jgi:antitoxin (DNA-binding transcriptional repressor) of toxin-antitoxin stability system
MSEIVLTMTATDFKAKCLAIFDELERRKVDRVVVTRRGRPVAELRPARAELPELWGAHRGSVKVARGVDLTAPTFDEPLDAELGLLHR